jgi:UDP-N-acetylglucosamine--N-acetylmuramyl-(pentapeptide) pyrophosphoryl-undecaprenol N-acetylglucosamine transferase
MTPDPTRPPATRAARRGGPRVLVAAGGTGGHVVPGLALARTIVEREPAATVTFAGTSRGIETRVVPEAGYALDLLPVLPLSRRLSLETVLAPFAALVGTVAAWRLLRRRRVDVVAGMGGYVTLPVALAARLAGVPVVLHEQNAVAGLANKLAVRVASRIALGVAEAASAFPPGKTVVVGNPVRPELLRLDRAALRAEALAAFGLEAQRRTLFVFGGSQGARRINQAVVAATASWPHPWGMQILHACGRRDEAAVREAWQAANPEARGLVVRVVPFVDRMDLAYAAADLALTRAGAMTMAELTVVGMPAVMVPLPHATNDHQRGNARAAAAAGGALPVEDADLDGPTLAAAAAPLLSDPGALARMGRAMLSLAHPRAAEDMASLVLDALPAGRRPTHRPLAGERPARRAAPGPRPPADVASGQEADIASTQEFVGWFHGDGDQADRGGRR